MTNGEIYNRRTIKWDWHKGQELRALRVKKGFRSQEKLAEEIGVDTNTVGRWERGEVDIRDVSWFTVRCLVYVLGDECAALLKSLEEGPLFEVQLKGKQIRYIYIFSSHSYLTGSDKKRFPLLENAFLYDGHINALW